MEEQDLNSVEEEFATQETDDNDFAHESDEIQPNSEDIKKAEEQERNWKNVRLRQKELEIALKQKDEILERLLSQQKPSEPPPIVEEEDPDDDYVPAGKVKGIARKTVQPLEKKIQDLEARLAKQDEDKLMRNFMKQYPDFDDVVNVETLELLEKKEPELARTIAEMKNPYAMGLQAYKYIKAFGYAEELPNARRVKEVDQKLAKNSKSVQSPQAFDKRPMAQAFKSTAADQKRLYEEMMHYASQATGL
jgi:hypothetical protein